MKIAWTHPHRLAIILIIVIGMLTGCASVFQDLDDRMHRKRFKSDYEALEKALAVYEESGFEEAMTQFKALSAASASEIIARKAWLGEICCRLMLANTQADYTTAIGLWHDFGNSTRATDAAWNLALLDPLIVRLTPPPATTPIIEIRPPVAQPTAEIATPAVAKQDDRPLQAELASLRKKVEQTAQLQHRIDEVVAENNSLKEKIKALEAIDQNIQKKKTELVTPSE